MAVNLEGVIVTSLPDAKRVRKALVMEKEITLGWLKALNVKLAGSCEQPRSRRRRGRACPNDQRACRCGNHAGARR